VWWWIDVSVVCVVCVFGVVAGGVRGIALSGGDVLANLPVLNDLTRADNLWRRGAVAIRQVR
jgi:hypothetical protein